MSKATGRGPRKPPAKGEYRNLVKQDKGWSFEVLTKTQGWIKLSGLYSETLTEDAEKFAQSTADSWRKR